MIYGFDLDDTLANTAELIDEYAKKYDVEYLGGSGKFEKNMGDSEDYYYFADALNWNNNDIKNFFEIYYIDILRNTKIKAGVKDFLNNLKSKGNDIYIISSRRKKKQNEIEKITMEWLEQNNIVYDKLFIGIKDKFELINQYNISVFVDDSYKICKNIQKFTNAKVYMIQNKYNENIQDDSLEKIRSIVEII